MVEIFLKQTKSLDLLQITDILEVFQVVRQRSA